MALPWSKEEGSEFQGLTLAGGSQEAAPGTVTVRGIEIETKKPIQTDRRKMRKSRWDNSGAAGPRVCAPTCPLPSSPHRDDLEQPLGMGQPSLIHTEEA